MKPIVIAPEQFSEDPGNNYLQFLLGYAVVQRSTEIYFYIEKSNIRVFRNAVGGGDLLRLKSIVPEISQILDEFKATIGNGLEQRVLPPGFFEEMPLPLSFLDDLEKAFKKIYLLSSLQDLKNEVCRDINVSGTKIRTYFEKIPQKDGLGYHMRIDYLGS